MGRLILFILAFLIFSQETSYAGTSQCRDTSDRQYVQVGIDPQGNPLYDVYCTSYPNPSGSSSGPGGGVSNPIVDMTLVKLLHFSIFTIWSKENNAKNAILR